MGVRKVIIWGIGTEYEGLLNQIKHEILKGTIQVEALVAKTDDIVCDNLDGFKIVGKEKLSEYAYDFVIITSTVYFEEILKETQKLGIKREKVIAGRLFNIPNFDFERYVKLIENPVTILSDDCWGGLIYYRLGLKLTTPFINILIYPDSYARFIQDPIYYLSQPLVMEREGDFRNNLPPIGSLGSKGEVLLNFVHTPTFEEAAVLWNKRKERINYNNLFVKMGFNVDEKSKEYLEIFAHVPYSKVCFYSGETDKEDVLYLKRFEWYVHLHPKGDTIHLGYNDYCRIFPYFSKSVDLLKMLNGEKNYLRER